MNKAQRDALCEYITASIIDNEEGLIVPEMVRSLFGKELGEGSEVDGVIDFFNEGALIVVEREDDLPRVELSEDNDPDRNKLYYCESEESFWLFDAEAGDIVKLNVGSRLMVDTTYSELKHMRDNGQLKPGCRYRITDYVTKANIPIQQAYNYENYLYHLAFSAEHPFDIIVLATDTDKVSDDAKAAPHNGDNYFADSRLNGWDIKYSLDNNLKYSWILDMNAVHLEITGPYEFSVITTKTDGQSPDYHNITEVIEYNPSYEALTTDVPAWLNEQIAWFNDMAVQQGSPTTITLGSSYLITPQRPTDYAMVIASNPFTRDTTQVVYFNRMSILTIEMDGARVDMPVVYDYDNDSVWDLREGGLDIYLGVTFGMEWSVMDTSGNQYVYELPEPKEEATHVSGCKGVIYYMKDEFGNECNYDFKNILYCEDYSMQSSYMDLYLDYTFNKFEGDYNGKSAPKKTVSGRRVGIDAKTVLAGTLSKVLDSLKSNARNGVKAPEELEVNVYMFYDASLNDYSTDYYASHHDIEHIPSVVSGNKVFGECGFNDEYGMYMEYLPNISMSSMWGGHITNNSIALTTENGVVFFSCYDFRDNKLSAPSIHSTFINCECCGAIYNQGDSIQNQMDGQPGQYGDDEWHQGDYRALNNRPNATITINDSDGYMLGSFNIGDDTQSSQTITIPSSEQVQSDWNQVDSGAPDYIKNKPSIPVAQIQSDWNQSNSSASDYIKNKPDVQAIADDVSDLQKGNFPDTWRTPTTDEWVYLMNTRSASTVAGTSDARYAKALVNGVGGVILIPDVFTLPSGISMTGINSRNVQYSANTYTAVQWEALDSAGCVFIPASGKRDGTAVTNVNSSGSYWSSTRYSGTYAWCMSFNNSSTMYPNIQLPKYQGYSVRLIKENASGGMFSLSAGTTGDIAKSNLQYHCLNKEWRFAPNAYDCIGNDNANISENYDGWIDLFGFGTSGWNSGAVCYQPWSASTQNPDYIDSSLTGNYAKADWGVRGAKKHLHDIAFTGDYNDLENIPAPSANMIETTWSSLVALRDGGNLVKGAFYRITDYNFVTTKINVQSGNHPFDLVVMAISENMVSENASVCRHTGDTYFMREITVGGIDWLYTMYVDSLGSAYGTGAMDHSEDMHSSDVFCDSDELVHPVTGNTVPVLYKTDSNDYGTDEPDYADAFYYEGTYNLDGDDYDMWSKYEYDEDNDEWVFAEQYALTPIVVEDGELVVSPIPETVTVPVNMNSWEVKYCLDNDTSLFDWATSGGKGVIYYMKDDFGNEAPYDFKNAMFKRYIISSVDDNILNNFVGAYLGQESYWKIVCGSNSQFFYTFSDNADDTIDASLSGTCNYNTIRPHIVDGKRVLNDIVLYNAVNNYIDTMCSNITISGSCMNNRIGSSTSDWLIYGCANNEIGTQSHQNTFYMFSANKVGNNFTDNYGAYANNNTFATMCQSNNFGSNLDGSSFGLGCRQLTFGSWCLSNTFGPSVMSSTFGNYFQYNTIEGWNSSIFFPNYSRYNTIEKGCNSITINTSGGGNYSYVQYVKICKCVSNQTLTPARNLAYETIYYKTGRDEHGVN